MVQATRHFTHKRRRVAIAAALVVGSLLTVLVIVRDGARQHESQAHPIVASPGATTAPSFDADGPWPPFPDAAQNCSSIDTLHASGKEDLPYSAYVSAWDALNDVSRDLLSQPSARAQGLALYAQSAARPVPQGAADASSDPAASAGVPAPSSAFLRFAVSSNDPDVYALAFYSCGARSDPAAGNDCGLVSATRWAQIDPENALPWLYIASDASQSKDYATRDEAYFRASRATTLDSRHRLLGELLKAMDTHGAPLAAQQATTINLAGWLAAQPLPLNIFQAGAFCSADASTDPNRRQVCNDLAIVLTERGDSLIFRHVGMRIGANTGWSPERAQTLHELFEAISTIELQAQLDARGKAKPALCAIRPAEFSDRLYFGEAAYSEKKIAASGKTVPELAAMREKYSVALSQALLEATPEHVAPPRQ